MHETRRRAAERPGQENGERSEAAARRPNVYQVAARAGVSIATVSRALREGTPVSPQTRERVLAAAKELSWRPNQAAQALAGVSHNAVAIVFPDLAGPYYARVISGFESEVVRQGSAVMVLATHGRAASELMVRDLAVRVDGLVIMDQTIPDSTVAEIVVETPVILLARPGFEAVGSVRSENVQAAVSVTRHLFGHGLRRLRFMGDPARTPDVRERWLGFVQAHAADDVPLPAEPLRCAGFEAEHGYQAALDVLQDSAIDGIVCANDELASGVYRAAADTGRVIPDDLAVTGWDDVSLAEHVSPPLTTIRQQVGDLGATAARLLFDRMEAREAPDRVLPTELVVRESCGCRP
ncbi:MAG: LacI family DNA-binding transcriptional regulator [Micromonosporaceae bacterium]